MLGLLLLPQANLPAQEDAVDFKAEADRLLGQMDVAERVGQLFLVTFQGSSAATETAIAELIQTYKVGGVALLPENDNFVSSPESALQLAHLTNQLQQWALLGRLIQDGAGELAEDIPPTATPLPEGASIPLFIALNYPSHDFPYNPLLDGVTTLPSQMGIGATWQPEYAQDMGEIAGQEWAALGVNMVLGPSLDVLEKPAPNSLTDLGTQVFGGDPYWVGQMGRAYIAGIHQGSQNRIVVIAKHFPGNGSSDRPIDQEVSTVRKSLEQLKQIELAPFFAVTATNQDPLFVTDGLLVTHIRYQGFQGNIRATTAPISFDLQALDSLMALPELSTWREEGGILVTDKLGVRAVQRFYDDTEQEFPHRRVARDALLAGNDLLFLADFGLGDANDTTQLANIQDTIRWFQERYGADLAFRQRVDEAVRQLLLMKLRLYGGDFGLENVIADAEELATLSPQDSSILFDLAQEALTLISPSKDELPARLLSPPTIDEKIVIFTDVRQVHQCSSCPNQPYLSQTALAERLLALYGPEAGGQVQSSQIQSFSFADLNNFLEVGSLPLPPPTPTLSNTLPTAQDSVLYAIQDALKQADWVLFALLNVSPQNPDSNALNNFLAKRPDLARSLNVVVFAYGAPYYLDTTEISKLAAYYAVYSPIPPFLDTSVRALFQGLPPKGVSPVNVEGIGYDLFRVTQPTAQQVIELHILSAGVTQSPPDNQPLEFVVGDTLRLQTGVILDQNGHSVPDGTLVQFRQLDRINGFVSLLGERSTVGGVANLDYVLEARTGQFRITASAGEAVASQEVYIVIGDNVQIVVITPTPVPTTLPTPTTAPTSLPEPTETVPPTPSLMVTVPASSNEPTVQIPLSNVKLLLGMSAGICLLSVAVFVLGQNQRLNPTLLIRFLLWGMIGGLLAYLLFLISGWLAGATGWAALWVTVIGGAIGITLLGFKTKRADPSTF